MRLRWQVRWDRSAPWPNRGIGAILLLGGKMEFVMILLRDCGTN